MLLTKLVGALDKVAQIGMSYNFLKKKKISENIPGKLDFPKHPKPSQKLPLLPICNIYSENSKAPKLLRFLEKSIFHIILRSTVQLL